MIIRMTVNDNDFGEILENFAKNLSSRITKIPRNIENMEPDEQLARLRELKQLDRLLNPNVTANHTEEEKALICDKVREAFDEYVSSIKRLDAYTILYLSERFSAEIITSMEDKWENGEVVYWFQHSGKWISQ